MIPSESQWPRELSAHTRHRCVFENTLHHLNEPQGHGGRKGEQRSCPPEKVNMVRRLCHSILPSLKADGNAGELTDGCVGDLQDPSQHEDENHPVAPSTRAPNFSAMFVRHGETILSRRGHQSPQKALRRTLGALLSLACQDNVSACPWSANPLSTWLNPPVSAETASTLPKRFADLVQETKSQDFLQSQMWLAVPSNGANEKGLLQPTQCSLFLLAHQQPCSPPPP